MNEDSFLNTIIKRAVTETNVLPIANILLHLRYWGLKKNTRAERRKIVLMAVPLLWFGNLVLLPLTLISYFKSFFLSLAIAIIPYHVFGLLTNIELLMLVLLLWSSLNYKEVSTTLTKFFIDLIDFTSGGQLTEKFIYAYSTLPKKSHMNFINSKNYFLVLHFFTCRQIWGDKREGAWEDYFTTLCTKYLNDKKLLDAEVESYWEKISQPQNVYRLHNPPSLKNRVNWNYEDYWKTATLASLQHAIETTSEINELRIVSGFSKRTLLGCAVSYGATYQMIEMLIDADADVNFPQESPFEGHFSIFQLAVSLSCAKTVQFLLDKGVDIELASASGQFNRNNIMQHAALFAKQPESLLAVKYACDNSSLLIDNRGNTFLHYLAGSDSDRSDFIDILIESGANIEGKNNRFTQRQSLPNCEPEFGGEQTALLSSLSHSLELYNHGCEGSAALENLKCLLEHGASVSATDAHGRNAFHVLSVSQRYDSNELEKLRLLQSNGADINAKDIKGETPLFNAVQSKSLEFINTLIELGADCDVVSKDETSVFCSACFRSVDKDDKESETEFFGILERLLDKSASQKEIAGFWDEPVSILKARLNRGYLQLSDVPIKSPLYPFLKDLL